MATIGTSLQPGSSSFQPGSEWWRSLGPAQAQGAALAILVQFWVGISSPQLASATWILSATMMSALLTVVVGTISFRTEGVFARIFLKTGSLLLAVETFYVFWYLSRHLEKLK